MVEPDAQPGDNDQSGAQQTPANGLREGWLEQPRPERFDQTHPAYDACMAAHREAVDDDSLGYRDPQTGLFVMTAQYLHDRAWCCDRGCRHCPYGA